MVEMIKSAYDVISEREMVRAGGDFTADLMTKTTDSGHFKKAENLSFKILGNGNEIPKRPPTNGNGASYLP